MKRNTPIIFFLFYSLLLFGQKTDTAGIPDYSKTKFWAALPSMDDRADKVPDTSLKNLQGTAKADVFFIHPTTHLGFGWNQGMNQKLLNQVTDNVSIQNQASLFNGSCRVFAPRYRQANVFSFFVKSAKADTALEVAYADVKRAFEYYLEHYNGGRPIVIAAHSQGSRHAVQLLKEFFDGKPLSHKLIVAYLAGWVVKCNEFKEIAVCEGPENTGCFVSWNSFVWGADIFNDLTKDACCTNPLTWKTDTGYVPRDHHLGSVPPTFNKIDRQAVDAKCENGKLWVHLPSDISYWVAGLNYHVLDYNLFYLDVRENVKTRVESYFAPENQDNYR